jgi:hypothetical protein
MKYIKNFKAYSIQEGYYHFDMADMSEDDVTPSNRANVQYCEKGFENYEMCPINTLRQAQESCPKLWCDNGNILEAYFPIYMFTPKQPGMKVLGYSEKANMLVDEDDRVVNLDQFLSENPDIEAWLQGMISGGW